MSQPVIVVGAGPTGLMLAAELGLAKVPVVFLERRAEPTFWSQAFAIHMSSVEMFKQRGLDRFADARRFTNYNFGFPGLTTLDDSKLPLIVSQRRVEQLLEERVREIGVPILRDHEVVGIEQDEAGVTAIVRTPAGERRIPGSYLVGCDGGRSVVRKLAGIDFPGTGPTLCGRTGDMEILNEEYQDGIPTRMHPKGLAAVIRHPDEPGMCRATSIEFGAERPSEDVPMTADEFRDSFRRVTGIELRIGRTPWLTRFGDSTRQADNYRAGRVFIGGDAAHIHFPSAGQGLNTGMQDAMNLGWKLAGAWHGWASEDVLDSYHAERHPVGHEACVYPQAQLALMYPPEKAKPLSELIGRLVQFPDVSKYLIERSTGLGIRYQISYDGEPAGEHPLLGKRVPDFALAPADPQGSANVARTLHEGHGVVLDLSGGAASLGDLSGWKDRVDVVAADPIPQAEAAVLLLRPDGHVAFADPDGRDEEGLHRALTFWFGKA